MDVVWQVVGWVSSAVLIVSLMQTRIMRLRILNLIGCILSILFNAVVANWPVFGLNVALAGINVYQLWRLKHTRHDPSAYEVVRVEPTSSLATRFAARHAQDIAAELPQARPDSLQTCDDAFLILREDELMGLVAMRRDQGGQGHVMLDYVTPPYRDTTPGEFVFRTSTVLTDRGYTSVVAPAAPGSYYPAIGFATDPAGYRLTLTPAAP